MPEFFNAQLKEPIRKHPRPWVDIVDIFLTIQGEGPEHGKAAVFIRTAGCNLDCPLCDTDYTTNRKVVLIDDIVAKVKELRNKCLVVITGGEPFRQNTTQYLCEKLLLKGYQVQIETNGCFWWDDL